MDRRGIHPVDRLRISDSSAAKSLRIPAASAAGLPGRVLPGICGGVRSAHRLHRERGRSASIKGLDQAIVRRPLSDPNGSSRYPFGYRSAAARREKAPAAHHSITRIPLQTLERDQEAGIFTPPPAFGPPHALCRRRNSKHLKQETSGAGKSKFSSGSTVRSPATRSEEGVFKRRKVMKRIASIALFALVSFVTVGFASAQERAVKADVPFDFTVGNKLVPAGTYTISAVFVQRNRDSEQGCPRRDAEQDLSRRQTVEDSQAGLHTNTATSTS